MKNSKQQFESRCQLARQKLERGAESADSVCSELFDLGYRLESRGESEAADSIYQQTIDLLEDIKAQPGSSLTDSSMARLAFRHGKSLLHFGKPRSSIAAFRRALEITEQAIGCSYNGVLLEQQGIVLGWLGNAQRQSGNLEDAVTSYNAAIGIWRKLPDMIGAPVAPYDGFLGACLLGLSKAYNSLKLSDDAENAKAEAEELLEKEFEVLRARH